MGPLGIQSIHPFIRCLPCADECVSKYGNGNAWKYCTRVFDYMTLAAVCGRDKVKFMNAFVCKAVETG
jgi:diadenosine tetraphosphatase ApaH/serine/threonine PP2A family protein phosphatase